MSLTCKTQIYRGAHERRRDMRLRDAVDIGIVYLRLFGAAAAREQMLAAGVGARIAERVLAGVWRAKLFIP